MSIFSDGASSKTKPRASVVLSCCFAATSNCSSFSATSLIECFGSRNKNLQSFLSLIRRARRQPRPLSHPPTKSRVGPLAAATPLNIANPALAEQISEHLAKLYAFPAQAPFADGRLACKLSQHNELQNGKPAD